MDDLITVHDKRTCRTCGAGFREYIACEASDCALETHNEAYARIMNAKYGKNANDK